MEVLRTGQAHDLSSLTKTKGISVKKEIRNYDIKHEKLDFRRSLVESSFHLLQNSLT